MNSNNFDPQIKSLKDVIAPEPLKARIVKSVLGHKQNKNMTTRKIIGFGLPALIVLGFAVTIAMTPQPANAEPIQAVEKAFSKVTDYHAISYIVIDGKRDRFSESWMVNGKRTAFLVDKSGNLKPEFVKSQPKANIDKASSKPTITEKTKSQTDKKKGDYTKKEVFNDGKTSKWLIMYKDDSGKVAKWYLVKNLVTGEVIKAEDKGSKAELSPDYLLAVLQKPQLWQKPVATNYEGQVASIFKANGKDFTITVNQQNLPVLTRQTWDKGGKAVAIEVEYRYGGLVPPANGQN